MAPLAFSIEDRLIKFFILPGNEITAEMLFDPFTCLFAQLAVQNRI